MRSGCARGALRWVSCGGAIIDEVVAKSPIVEDHESAGSWAQEEGCRGSPMRSAVAIGEGFHGVSPVLFDGGADRRSACQFDALSGTNRTGRPPRGTAIMSSSARRWRPKYSRNTVT